MIARSIAAIESPKIWPFAFSRADGQALQVKSLIAASVAFPGVLFWNLT